MPILKWRQTAIRDLLAIIDYIADDNPDAAQELKDELEAKSAALLKHPHMYRTGRIPGTREMVVQTNYVVVYTEGDNHISILRVLHAAQLWP